jgi:isocitrate dehydrogenase
MRKDLMTPETTTIVYTKIDEAPALATYSLLPVLQSFCRDAGIVFEPWDISLAGRILAAFPEYLQEEQRVPDYLARLRELVRAPEANVVKLPNISASLPQLKEAVEELRHKGYAVPQYPDKPENEEEVQIRKRYGAVLGSAVNPVLREGNSDRRAAPAVKQFARKKPHSMMKPWLKESKTRVAHMEEGDFYHSEKSYTMPKETKVSLQFVGIDGKVEILKENIELLSGEVVDSAVMSINALRRFYEEQMDEAKKEKILLSLHLKATMMKVSDPIMFGHCVSVYFRDVFAKYEELFRNLGVNEKNGLSDVYTRLEKLPEAERNEVEAAIRAVYRKRPALAMVDSGKGITNLHVPNNVIIDASMPVVIRDGGRMWGPDDALHDTLAIIPDSSYATIYGEVVEDCRQHGAFDPAVMGSVANVGLMARKAEEYGSHDKTFVAAAPGTVQIIEASGKVLLQQTVETGDIFRMCQVKDDAVHNWVKLAVDRATLSGEPAVFWLDHKRAHDRELIAKVELYLQELETSELDIRILAPVDAMRFTLKCVRLGENTISVTGNVLRDYLTDLFPILELGTSAKMLSIVPLMNGGGLFEAGAGGSAPRHVRQFLREGHLRWDSLGEFCALSASLEHCGNTFHNDRAHLLAKTLDQAIGKHLEMGRAPSRKVNELDSRGSHYYLALYWAKALAEQDRDEAMRERFRKMADALAADEAVILEEINTTQGRSVDIGGYYYPDEKLAEKAMRPSVTLNSTIEKY